MQLTNFDSLNVRRRILHTSFIWHSLCIYSRFGGSNSLPACLEGDICRFVNISLRKRNNLYFQSNTKHRGFVYSVAEGKQMETHYS